MYGYLIQAELVECLTRDYRPFSNTYGAIVRGASAVMGEHAISDHTNCITLLNTRVDIKS